jgi:hypothetical protein
LQRSQHRVLHRRDLLAMRLGKRSHRQLVRPPDPVAGFGLQGDGGRRHRACWHGEEL